jgi:1,4-alpha-glucan branching enzyme
MSGIAEPEGFQWIEADDAPTSRSMPGSAAASPARPNVVVICNFTPVERRATGWACRAPGRMARGLNTDAAIYGGANRGNLGGSTRVPNRCATSTAQADIVLPPLSAIMFCATPG